MSYEVIAAEYFKRRYTKLRKTYRRIEEDYASLLEILENNPLEGEAIPGFGNKIYKLRIRSTNMKRGKRGGYLLNIKWFLKGLNRKFYKGGCSDGHLWRSLYLKR